MLGLPLWLSWLRIHLQCGRPGFDPSVGKIPWRRDGLPTPVFWPGEFQRLYSLWGHKESDMTERLSLGRIHQWISLGRIHQWSCCFLWWEVFDYGSIVLTCWYVLMFDFFHESVLVGCMFLGIYPFFLGNSICCHITVQGILLWPFLFLWH